MSYNGNRLKRQKEESYRLHCSVTHQSNGSVLLHCGEKNYLYGNEFSSWNSAPVCENVCLYRCVMSVCVHVFERVCCLTLRLILFFCQVERKSFCSSLTTHRVRQRFDSTAISLRSFYSGEVVELQLIQTMHHTTLSET